MQPMCVPACLWAIFQKSDTELGLDEILLNLLNCKNTSGMRLKHYPKASLFLILSKYVPELNNAPLGSLFLP